MDYKPIGNLIKLVKNLNKDMIVTNLLGVNINKNFMPSVANQSGLDLSKYKVISKNQFATNIMHVDRDEVLPVALYYDENPAIISPAYKIFEVIDEEEILPEFLMMEFQRPEFDRKAWTYCDSSVRGGLEWDRFCELKIPVPSIATQKKFVAIYKALIENQKIYQESLADLQLICDSFLDSLRKNSNLKKLGNYIQQIDEKNREANIDYVQGISIEKKFIETKANMAGVSLDSYKVVRKDDFAFNPNTSRNGDKLAIAINNSKPCIVSSIYVVFGIIDKNKLMPDYLYLWFKRSEFDRYARFHSWGSAREIFDWNDICDVNLPIPDINTQKSIVQIYKALEARKEITGKLVEMIRPLSPVLIKGVVNLKETQH